MGQKEMKKTLILVGGLVVILVMLALASLLKSSSIKKTAGPGNIPIASTSPNPSALLQTYGPLSISSTDPADKTAEIPLNQVFKIYFNRAFFMNEISLSFGPGVGYSTNISGNVLTITPNTSLAPGATYSYVIGFKATNQSSTSFSFTTTGPKVSASPETGDVSLANKVEDYNKQNHPDIFLSYSLPHLETLFSATKGGFKPDPAPDGHYYFIVTLTGADQAGDKQSLAAWLQSLGLSDDQTSRLDFVYLTPSQATTVSNFKDNLPYYGGGFTLLYDKGSDATTAILHKATKTTDDQALNAYLAQNGIQDRYWINNLTVKYQ